LHCTEVQTVDLSGYFPKSVLNKIQATILLKIVKSIYKMMGPNQALVDQFETPEKRAEDIFHRMDVNSDGRVTRQEFVKSCINDNNLAQLLSPKL